jgi:CRP-like cAMP-binding protein
MYQPFLRININFYLCASERSQKVRKDTDYAIIGSQGRLFCFKNLPEMVKKQKSIEQGELEDLLEICQFLNPKQKEEFICNCEIHRLKKNQMLYAEGDKPEHIMCLLRGKIKITKKGVGGRNHIVRMVRPGGYFAYRASLAGTMHSTSATAFEVSDVGVFPSGLFIKLLRQNGELAFYFIKALAVDLGFSDSRQVNLTQKYIRGRLAESLLFMRNHYGLDEDGATINIYLSREDLANLSNMTTSNAIRTLSMFVSEKVITLDGRRIKIIDEDKLERISRLG